MKKLFTMIFMSVFTLSVLYADTYEEKYDNNDNHMLGDQDFEIFYFDFLSPNAPMAGYTLTDIDLGSVVFDDADVYGEISINGTGNYFIETWVYKNGTGYVLADTESDSLVAGVSYNYDLSTAALAFFNGNGMAKVKVTNTSVVDGLIEHLFTIDEVRMEASATCAPIPEPSSYALMLVGLFGLAAYRRRRS